MYNIELCAYNVLGKTLPNVVLSVNNDGNVKFASYFESQFTAMDFETTNQAMDALNDFLKETEKLKLCEIDIDEYIIIRESYPMFYKTGYELRLIK